MGPAGFVRDVGTCVVDHRDVFFYTVYFIGPVEIWVLRAIFVPGGGLPVERLLFPQLGAFFCRL